MSSYSLTESQTFTITDAKQMASKVATDLLRIQRLYGGITDEQINNYEKELTLYIKEGYLENVTYGFQKDNEWYNPTVKYTAKEITSGTLNDDPGKIRPNSNISGTSFTSFLTYSSKWYTLSSEEKETFRKTLPFSRGTGTEPGVHGGYFSQDKIYSAGGRSLSREIVRSY